jgi:tetratricopeptide (TPR) repeat protein
MPLALELAASWLKVLPIKQVLAALERDLGALTARDRTIPERHRSMRVVLEEAWRLLDAEHQRQLAGLSIFVGGFDASAAQAVAGATLDGLANLVDQALLHSNPDGRFQLHELLRQFGREKLAASGGEAGTQQRHSRYYLELLAGGGEPVVEIENIRAAWAWAVAQCDRAPIERSIDAAYALLSTHGLYHAGFRDFAAAANTFATCDALPVSPGCQLLQARLLGRQGSFNYLLGDYQAATAQLEASLQVARSLALPREQAFALATLGQISAWRGDYPTAVEQLRESLALSRAAATWR